MSSRAIDQQILLAKQTLFGGGDPYLPLIVALPVSRYLLKIFTATNDIIYVKPAKGTKWTVIEASYTYTASGAVGNRVVTLEISPSIVTLFIETLAASAVGAYSTGHPAASANGGGSDTLNKEFVCTSEFYLKFFAESGGLAADTLTVRAMIKEEVDYDFARPEG